MLVLSNQLASLICAKQSSVNECGRFLCTGGLDRINSIKYSRLSITDWNKYKICFFHEPIRKKTLEYFSPPLFNLKLRFMTLGWVGLAPSSSSVLETCSFYIPKNITCIFHPPAVRGNLLTGAVLRSHKAATLPSVSWESHHVGLLRSPWQ